MKIKIGGLVKNADLTLYRMTAVQDQPGQAGRILKVFAENQVNLEYITEASTDKGYAVMAVCVSRKMADKIDQIFASDSAFAKTLNIKKIENISVIGIYGPHFREKPALAARFCSRLGKAEINILGLSSSISSIAAVIRNEDLVPAVGALLDVFELP